MFKNRSEWVAEKNKLKKAEHRDAMAAFISDPGFTADVLRDFRRETPAVKGMSLKQVLEFVWENRDTWLPILVQLIVTSFLAKKAK